MLNNTNNNTSSNSKKIIQFIFQYKYWLILASYAFWLTLLDNNNLISLFKLKKEISKYETKKEYYENEIAQLHKEHNTLTNNIDACIEYGRREFYVKKKNEQIFVIVPEEEKNVKRN